MDIAPPSKNNEIGPLNKFLKFKEGYVEICIPLFTASEANGGVKKSYRSGGKTRYKAEQWWDKAKRHRQQKAAVAYMLRPHRHLLRLPCRIELIRFAPRKLDRFDNLPMSLKYVLDGICEVITGDYCPGRADSHEGFEVSYDQFTSKEYYVLIKITNKEK